MKGAYAKVKRLMDVIFSALLLFFFACSHVSDRYTGGGKLSRGSDLSSKKGGTGRETFRVL